MDDSLASWLLLREPADTQARSASLTQTVAEVIATTARDAVHVLDLGTGTGSNLRYLVSRLPPRQSWLVVDRDPTVLALVPARTSSWGASQRYEVSTAGNRSVVRGTELDCRVETEHLDLVTLDTPDIFVGRDLVTASALLDLVSEEWLRALAARCRTVAAAALFAINYNGRSSCVPAEPEDDMIRVLLNRHQTRSRGARGSAAGPDATAFAARYFAEVGYQVETAQSDWVLGASEDELQRQLVEGWAAAATEIAPGDTTRIDSWLERRLGHIDAGHSRVRVGHVDLAAWLPHA